MLSYKNLYQFNFSIFIIAILFTLISCEDENPQPVQILEEDIAIAIEGAVMPNAGGLISQIEAIVLIAVDEQDLGCDEQNDSTLNQVIDSRNSFSYTWKIENTCDLDEKPFEMTNILEGNRRYLTNELSANEKVKSEIYLSGFNNNDRFTLNLQSEIEGSYRAGNDILNGYVGKIAIIGTDIIINKDSQVVSSGTLNFVFSGASISGSFFNYAGIIEFAGGNSANLSFEEGGTYTINW